MPDTFYITTPIYYVNDVPHIGHAYTTVAADVLARFARLTGHDTFFLTGLDEHGQKVQQAAAKAGVPPQEYCDRLAPQFQNLWRKLNISNDDFVRTTEPRHKQVVQQALQMLYDRGEIYQDAYTGWYCTFDERFWTEKDVGEGLCPECKRPVERLSEKNYFFRMSRYRDWLIEHVTSHPDFIKPATRRNEVLGFLQQNLGDLSISRPKSRLSWGIDLPFDTDYVTYVWFDALVNYISIPGYLVDPTRFARWWPADYHLIGKDILTTHSVYWSTMLRALGLELPRTIFAHGWWTVNGEKMSKSRGNVVDPYAMVNEFGTDAFRYFLLREVPFGQDGDFSRDALIARVNTDLANDLGNLLSRTVTLIERFSDGMIPEGRRESTSETEASLQTAARQVAHDVPARVLHDAEFHRALEHIWTLVQAGNQYLERTAPWSLAKRAEDRPALHAVLYNAAETLRILALLLSPFMPATAEELARQLGCSVPSSGPLPQDALSWGGLRPGTRVTKGRPLFPRIDVRTAKGDQPVTEPAPPTTAPPAIDQKASPPAVAPAVEEITIDDFKKIQFKTALVVSAERIPRSDKLLKLQVDLGDERRQIVAGIGKRYDPEYLIGKRIVIVANLKPAKLMGVESQGMVLAAGDKDVGGLVTIMEEVPPGTKVK